MSLAPFPQTTFVGILSRHRYTMRLTAQVGKMCGGARKRPGSDYSNASGGPSKSPRRDSVKRVPTSKVSEMDLDGIPVPRRSAVDIDRHSGVGVGVLRYAGVGYRGPATQSVRLAHEVAIERALPIAGCNWDSVDIMDYV